MIKNLRKATDSEWWFHANQDPTATFFQTPSWFQIWSRFIGYTCESLHFELKNGKTGVLPMAGQRIAKGLLKKYIISPGGTYGGVVTRYDLTESELNLIYKIALSKHSYIFRVNPFQKRKPKFNGGSFIEDSTYVINLRDTDPKNILSRWRKGHKADAKRAIREGVNISISHSIEDFKLYYDVYLSSLERWGTKRTSFYDFSLFQLLSTLPLDKIRLWVAKYRGKLVSGCLCFYHNQHVVYWHGAGLSEYFKLGAVHALQREIIAHALENGYHFYDFNPSGGHTGVEKFKRGFGTSELSAPVIKKIGFKETILSGTIKIFRI